MKQFFLIKDNILIRINRYNNIQRTLKEVYNSNHTK